MKITDDGKGGEDKGADAAVDIQWELSAAPENSDSAEPAVAGSDASGLPATVKDIEIVTTTKDPSHVIVNEAMYEVYGRFLNACRWFDVNEDHFLHFDHLCLILQSSSRYFCFES